MKVEIYNVITLKLLPETDADRAILSYFSTLNDLYREKFRIQGVALRDGMIVEMFVGFE